jgi:hypothetical protein
VLPLVGTWGYLAGTTGTVVVPQGARVIQIVAHASSAGAALLIFNGDSIPVIDGAAPLVLPFLHGLLQSGNDTTTAGSQDIVFSNTDSYFVEYVKSGNT